MVGRLNNQILLYLQVWSNAGNVASNQFKSQTSAWQHVLCSAWYKRFDVTITGHQAAAWNLSTNERPPQQSQQPGELAFRNCLGNFLAG